MNETKVARVILWAFHPLLMPFYAFLILLSPAISHTFYLPVLIRWTTPLIILLLNGLLPALTIRLFFQAAGGFLENLDSRVRESYPYLVTAIFYYISAYVIKSLQLPGIFYLFALAATLVVIAILFIKLVFSPDLHTLACGALTGSFFAIAIRWNLGITWLLLVMLGVTGLTAYASLLVKKAEPSAVYGGFLIGSGLMVILFTAF